MSGQHSVEPQQSDSRHLKTHIIENDRGVFVFIVSADYNHVHETRRLFDFIELISED